MKDSWPGVVLMVAVDAEVTGILLGAVLAALGFVGKLIIEGVRDWRRELARRRARLLELQALLRAGSTAFTVQNELALRLARDLEQKHPGSQMTEGFEDLFARLYSSFDDEDSETHNIIRGYTEHALRPLNQAILAWLQADVEHRATRSKDSDEIRLAAMLNDLDAHLRLWLAKYEAWIPNKPEHALVYLADEKKHGRGFPKGLEETLEKVLTQK